MSYTNVHIYPIDDETADLKFENHQLKSEVNYLRNEMRILHDKTLNISKAVKDHGYVEVYIDRYDKNKCTLVEQSSLRKEIELSSVRKDRIEELREILMVACKNLKKSGVDEKIIIEIEEMLETT
jgi:hypothetical protein